MKKILELNEKYNDIKFLSMDDGYLLVGKTPSKMFKGYYYLDGKIFHTSKYMLQSGCNEILFASKNLNLDGVPLIENSEEDSDLIKPLITKLSELALLSLKNKDDFWNDKASGFGEAIQMLKDIEKNIFVEKQVREAIILGGCVETSGKPTFTIDEVIETVKNPRVEIIFDDNNQEIPIKSNFLVMEIKD